MKWQRYVCPSVCGSTEVLLGDKTQENLPFYYFLLEKRRKIDCCCCIEMLYLLAVEIVHMYIAHIG